MTVVQQDHWDGVYDAKDEAEVSWFEPAPRLSLDLIGRTNAPLDTAIIDIGGGLSRLADALVETGHSDVTVLDISEQAVRKRGERGGTVHGKLAVYRRARGSAALRAVAVRTIQTPERHG